MNLADNEFFIPNPNDLNREIDHRRWLEITRCLDAKGAPIFSNKGSDPTRYEPEEISAWERLKQGGFGHNAWRAVNWNALGLGQSQEPEVWYDAATHGPDIDIVLRALLRVFPAIPVSTEGDLLPELLNGWKMEGINHDLKQSADSVGRIEVVHGRDQNQPNQDPIDHDAPYGQGTCFVWSQSPPMVLISSHTKVIQNKESKIWIDFSETYDQSSENNLFSAGIAASSEDPSLDFVLVELPKGTLITPAMARMTKTEFEEKVPEKSAREVMAIGHPLVSYFKAQPDNRDFYIHGLKGDRDTILNCKRVCPGYLIGEQGDFFEGFYQTANGLSGAPVIDTECGKVIGVQTSAIRGNVHSPMFIPIWKIEAEIERQLKAQFHNSLAATER